MKPDIKKTVGYENIKYDSEKGKGALLRNLKRIRTMPLVAAGAWTDSKAFCGPLFAQLEPVSACNYACCFCRDHGEGASGNFTGKSGQSVMPLEMVESLAKNLKKLGTLGVELIGRGEPLLHPDFLGIVEILRKNRLEVILYTNGALLTSDIARKLVALGVRSIRISINAGSSVTHQRMAGVKRSGDFEKIIDTAESIVEFKRSMGRKLPTLIYGFVLIEENYREAVAAVEIAARTGIDAVLFKDLLRHEVSSRHAPLDRRAVDFSLYKAGMLASKLEVLTNLDINSEMPLLHEDYRAISQIVFKHVPCYLPWFFTLITSDGNVFPCCQCKGTMGNLSEKSFKEIWTGILYSRFRHSCKLLPENDGKPLKGCECDNCNYASRNLVFHRLIKPFDLNPAFGHSANIIGKLLKFKDI